MPRIRVALVLSLACSLLAWGIVVPSGSAGAQEPEAPTTSVSIPESGGMIPRPNSGVEPTDAGDRGGALQTALFFGLIVAVAGGTYMVVRESRARRAQRGF